MTNRRRRRRRAIALLFVAAALGGCDPTIIAHLRNDTGDTIGVLREARGHSWCWTSGNSGLDTFRLPPQSYIRLGIGYGRGADDARRSIACDTVAFVIGGRRRLLTRAEIDTMEVHRAGSTYFFHLR